MTLKLINCLTKKVYFIENLEENYRSSDLFYCFDIKLPEDIVEGEFNYVLLDDDVALVEGVLQVGDYEPERVSYNNKEVNGYTVYEG